MPPPAAPAPALAIPRACGFPSASTSVALWQGVLRRVGPPLSPSQMLANKILAALGAHKWVPKTQGQRGVRILCFDGGGTRGVLTLALLKHVEKVSTGQNNEAYWGGDKD